MLRQQSFPKLETNQVLHRHKSGDPFLSPYLACFAGSPASLSERSSQPGVSEREPGSPGLQGHTAMSRSSGTRHSLCKSRRNSCSTEKNHRDCTQTPAASHSVFCFLWKFEMETCSNECRKRFSCYHRKKITVCTFKLLTL